MTEELKPRQEIYLRFSDFHRAAHKPWHGTAETKEGVIIARVDSETEGILESNLKQTVKRKLKTKDLEFIWVY